MEQNGCIGSIAELYDSAKPQLPKGAFAQGWSIAEIFRIILKKQLIDILTYIKRNIYDNNRKFRKRIEK